MFMLGIYTAPGGALLLDASGRVTACSFATNEHGFAELRASVRMPMRDAFALFDRDSVLHVGIYANGSVVWEGRLEDTGLSSAANGLGVTLTALGYWSALSDMPYTALWSVTSVAEWRPVRWGELVISYDGRHEFDTQNRIFITPKKGETIGPGINGICGYIEPNGGDRLIRQVTFTYATNIPNASWGVGLQSRDTAAWATPTGLWSVIGTGALLTGTITATLATPRDRLVFYINYGGAAIANPFETGDVYLNITNIRVKTTTSSAVYADEIATALVSYVNTINPTQLSASTALIQSPLVDLTDELYEDAIPSDVLTDLVARGDSQTPPRQWEVGVWENQELFFRPRGGVGQAWYVDVTTLELERSLAGLFNSVYAVYQDVSNRMLRTAVASDTTQVAVVGMTRRQAVGARTTSATNAARVRDAALNATKDPLPRADIRFDAVYTASGARSPLYNVRSGDTITLRNLPPNLSADIDRIRTFRIGRTDYDCISGVLSVEPEAPLPTLPAIVASLG